MTEASAVGVAEEAAGNTKLALLLANLGVSMVLGLGMAALGWYAGEAIR